MMFEKYLEMSKHELDYDSNPASSKFNSLKVAKFLFDCYMKFKRDNPTSILGDNIVMMYANDFYELKNKSEAYEKLVIDGKA